MESEIRRLAEGSSCVVDSDLCCVVDGRWDELEKLVEDATGVAEEKLKQVT